MKKVTIEKPAVLSSLTCGLVNGIIELLGALAEISESCQVQPGNFT